MDLSRANPSQKEAITANNKNILLSAGAGSGKTYVLTNRILYKMLGADDVLKCSINDFLVLTFTNLAAGQMKEKIRKELSNYLYVEGMEKELDKLESSSIVTFDSFCSKLVKKYSHIINVDPSFSIMEDAVVELYINNILEEILNEKYNKKDKIITKYFSDEYFKDKNDNSLKKALKDFYYKINKCIDPIDKLDSLKNSICSTEYIFNQYNKSFEYVKESLIRLINEIKELIEECKKIYDQICALGCEKLEKLEYRISEFDNIYLELIGFNDSNKSINLDSIKKINSLFDDGKGGKTDFHPFKSSLPKSSDYKDLFKTANKIKDNICKKLYFKGNYIGLIGSKELYDYVIYKDNYLKDFDLYIMFIDIIKQLYIRINSIKDSHNCYEFIDISRLAIKLLENKSIKEEISNSYKYILIDEYQDDNDIQEKLISLISNDNVFCVGDIKQSIYKFRNANPDIFNNKLKTYSKNKDSDNRLIIMSQNYRSNNKVIDDINKYFEVLMTNDLGEVNFKDDNHQLKASGEWIDESKTDRNLEALTYNFDEIKNQDNKLKNKKIELEAKIIADDIKSKINSKFQVYDETKVFKEINGVKELKEIGYRDCEFKDFAILLTRTTNVNTFIKVLENEGVKIALTIKKNISDDSIINIFSNALKLVYLCKEKLNKESSIHFFKAYVSLARSYLLNMIDDDTIFSFVMSNKTNKSKDGEKPYYEFKDNIDVKSLNDTTGIINIAINISKNINNVKINDLCYQILNDFGFLENLYKVDNVEEKLVVLEKCIQIVECSAENGFNLFEIADILEKMSLEVADTSSKTDISYKLDNSSSNAVKIMTVHMSKGLEFPIIYHPDLEQDLFKESKKDVLYLNDEFSNSNSASITQIFNNEKEIRSLISEKVRLQYVALTRAKEKNIFVIDNIFASHKLLIQSFGDMARYVLNNDSSIIKINNYDTDNCINLLYSIGSLKNKFNNYKSKPFDYSDPNFDFGERKEIINISHGVDKVLRDVDLENLEKGTYIHKLMQYLDFKNIDLSNYSNEDAKLIKNIISTEPFKNISNAVDIFKEEEYVFDFNGKYSNGIIDLLVIYKDHIDIIDYKYSNIEPTYYDYQLNKYKEYIKTLYKESLINCYLISAIKGIYRKVK